MHKTRPVTFNIPAGQPIETTSISSFKGIQYSDNPLNVDPDSASDMLNVYLNDSGTLTTRPRIEFEKKYTNMGKILNKVKLSETMNFYQSLDENLVKLWVETDVLYPVTLREHVIPETKISAFLKDDKIYVLAGDNYYVIKNINSKYILYNVVNDEDTKVPLHIVGDLGGDSTTESPYGINILNDKYEESFSWDGKTPIKKNAYDNQYVKKTNVVEIPNDDNPGYGVNGSLVHTKNTTGSSFLLWTRPQKYSEASSSYCKISKENGSLDVYKNFSTLKTVSYDSFFTDKDRIITASSDGKYALVIADIKNTNKKVLYRYSIEDSTVSMIFVESDNETGTGFADLKLPKLQNELQTDSFKISDDGNRILVTMCAKTEKENTYMFCVRYMYKNGDEWLDGGLAYPLSSPITVSDEYEYSTFSPTRVFVSSDWKKVVCQIYKTEAYSSTITDLGITENRKRLNITDYILNASPDLSKLLAITLLKTSTMFKGVSVNKYYDTNDYDPNDRVRLTYKDSMMLSNLTDHNIAYRYNSSTISNNGDVQLVVDKSNTIDICMWYEGTYSFVDFLGTSSSLKQKGWSNVVSNQLDPNVILFVKQSGSDPVEIFSYYIDGDPSNRITYITKNQNHENLSFSFDNHVRFQNNYWFYGNSNRIYYTSLNDPTYIEEYNYIDVGDDERITGMAVLSDNLLVCYKENELFLITRVSLTEDKYGYVVTETKGDIGNIPIGQNITTKYSELPLSFDNSGIFTISQVKNVTLSEHTTASLSSNIDKILLAEPNKETILTHNHRYWTYVIFPGETSKVYVLDNRTNEWYYWELPHSKIVSLWEEDEIGSDDLLYITTKYITEDGSVYALRIVDSVVQIDAINSNDYYTEYSDTFENQKEEIKWFWQSQILPLTFSKYSKSYPALGYRKQLIQTGFLFTDTDESEEYSLQYKFNVFRKNLSSVGERSISGTLNRVRSILKRTYIPRLNFLQIRIENSETDFVPQTNLPNTHNKLNLIQLKFKYKLMEEGV